MNTIKFLNSFPIERESFAADVGAIRNKLYALGVCWTDSVRGAFTPEEPFRVVLYTKRDRADFKNPLVGECNGLVLQYDAGWALLAMPPKAFCTNAISVRRLNDLYRSGNYDVFEALDATILTLYMHDGEWRLSSTKGYDIGDMEMIDGMSYMDVLLELLELKYKTFRLDDLLENHSYTIAMRYSRYHVFDETKHLGARLKRIVDANSYVLLMAAADLTKTSFVCKPAIGLPTQSPITVRDSTASMLMNYAKSAYDKYATAYRKNTYKYKPLYGYILRAKSRAVPPEYTTIFIESELFKAIKSGLYYDNGAIRKQDREQLIVQLTLNKYRYQQFKILFGQFAQQFENFERNIAMVAALVIMRITNDGVSDGQLSPEIEKLVCGLVDQFKGSPDVSVGIISDALYSRRYVHYLKYLVE